ncbi:fructose 1,6-bisphosphatase, partial (plasmid) [Listeria monocytogenes]
MLFIWHSKIEQLSNNNNVHVKGFMMKEGG